MAQTPSIHPVYRTINKPLTIWGVERRLFFLAALMGAATFNFFGSLLGGFGMFVALFLVARRSTVHDPQLLRILLSSARWRGQYDPSKRDAGGGRHA
jgi:type IV secretory pathway TrbD component